MGWIFCIDELPDEDGTYLVLWKSHINGRTYVYYEIQEFCDGEWAINIPQARGYVEIIAWQPLPEMPAEV